MISVLISRLLDPVSIAIAVLVAALAAEHFGRRALGRGLVIATALGLAAFWLLPLDVLVVKPLEDRYPPAHLPARVDGIVVLSGGLRPSIVFSRDAISYNATLPRIAAGAELARRFPRARLIFSGASSNRPRAQAIEFAAAERLFRAFGVAPGRTIYERRSLNTWENLGFTRQLVRPKPRETWVLVTSALHMPRAMGVARRLGWPMLPWPSDYESAGRLELQPGALASRRLMTTAHALREWVGLLAYRLEDR
ncbi:MAG TPA: YdcF family protein, partial [Rhizomicrobium sp.]